MKKSTFLKTFTLLSVLLWLASIGWGQTNPAAHDLSASNYSFTGFTDGATTTYPASMQGWSFSSEPTASTVAPPTDDRALATNSTAITTGSIRNEMGNGISLLNSGSNHIGAIVVALNTNGRQNITLSWVAQQLNSGGSGENDRINGLQLQYRIGTTENFITIQNTEYLTTNTTSQNPEQTFSNIVLPPECNNQPVVQVRWIYYISSGSVNARDRIRLDEILITSEPLSGNPQVATPTFDPPTGTYFTSQNVSIFTTTEGATIRYTTDGSDPDETSTEYTGPIAVSETTTIKAIAYAEGFDPSAVASATYTFPVTRKWSGLAETTSWADPDNWHPAGTPNPFDVVILDNSIVTEDYAVNLPGEQTTVEIVSLTITPASGKKINLNLPNTNTANPGLKISGTGDALLINSGGVFKNSSGASAGSGFELTNSGATIRINNGGHYIHNTIRAHAAAIVAKLSVAEGTELGVFEFDVPGPPVYSISVSGRNYGSLILSGATAGAKTYEFAGVNPLNIRGNIEVRENATLNSNMSGIITVFGDMVIKNTGIIYFSETSRVNVTGTLTNNAGTSGLVIKEGGSLIHNNAVAGTMEWTAPTSNWHFLSAPVSGMNILGSDFAPDGATLPTNFDFYAFNESVTNNLPWINLRQSNLSPNPAFTQFVGGKGYLVAYSATYPAGPFAFEGSLNTGDVSIDLAYTEGNEWAGWNLIGNPYPSGILWNPSEGSGLADAFAYVYDGSADQYVTVENGTLAPNQGFFVLANGNASNFTFTNTMRTHGGTYTKSNQAAEALVLKLSNATHADQTTIRVLEGTEFTRDFRDAIKMFSMAQHMPQLYSYTSDQVLAAINSVPHIDAETEFTIGLRIPANGQYTLSVSDVSGVFQASAIYLKDLQSGAVQNLSQQPAYSFPAIKGDDPARFIITFAQPTSVPGVEENLVRIYTYNNTLYLTFAEEAPNRLLQIYDLSARLVMSHRLDHGLNHTRQLNVEQGVYIVRVSSPAGVATQRVFVK